MSIPLFWLGFAVLVQFSLQVFALILLFKTPQARVRWGKRWMWALIILLGEIAGPLVFLVFGRLDEPADDASASMATGADADEATKKAVDLLYGNRAE
jgi:hypothetical protein